MNVRRGNPAVEQRRGNQRRAASGLGRSVQVRSIANAAAGNQPHPWRGGVHTTQQAEVKPRRHPHARKVEHDDVTESGKRRRSGNGVRLVLDVGAGFSRPFAPDRHTIAKIQGERKGVGVVSSPDLRQHRQRRQRLEADHRLRGATAQDGIGPLRRIDAGIHPQRQAGRRQTSDLGLLGTSASDGVKVRDVEGADAEPPVEARQPFGITGRPSGHVYRLIVCAPAAAGMHGPPAGKIDDADYLHRRRGTA